MKIKTRFKLVSTSFMLGIFIATLMFLSFVLGLFIGSADWVSILSTIGTIIAAGATCFTAYVAYKALDSWKAKRDYSELVSLQTLLESGVRQLDDSLTETQNYIFTNYVNNSEQGLKGLDVHYTELLLNVVDHEREVLRALDEIIIIFGDHKALLPRNLALLSYFFIDKHPQNYELHKQSLINRYDLASFQKAASKHAKVMDTQLSAVRKLKEDIRELV